VEVHRDEFFEQEVALSHAVVGFVVLPHDCQDDPDREFCDGYYFHMAATSYDDEGCKSQDREHPRRWQQMRRKRSRQGNGRQLGQKVERERKFSLHRAS